MIIKTEPHSSQQDSRSGKTEASSQNQSASEQDSLSSASDSSSTNSTTSSHKSKRPGTLRPHPPGFKEASSRVEKFFGKRAEDTFEVWLDDFEEATTDCGWTNKLRARWFLSGPAKATWQRTLTTEQKSNWKDIVKVFRGQYGVHVDPCTAYQRCNELQYDQLGSVQGLLNAMREYQRMAAQKLSDSILESILWNKVPIKLQQEVKEITDGSVQELVMKLLRAESVVAERKRCSQETQSKPFTRQNVIKRGSDTRGTDMGKKSDDSKFNSSKDHSQKNSIRRKSTFQGAEGMQHIKCYKCKAKGHMAKECPEVTSKAVTKVIEPGPIC